MAQSVLIHPLDPAHRLVGDHLAAFLDRLVERIIALGGGAEGTLRAGKQRASFDTYMEMKAAIDAAREACRGKHDLLIELSGAAQQDFARYIGARACAVTFEAFVKPKAVPNTDAHACWWVRLDGATKAGLGERFLRERRRLAGTPFFHALEGTARTPLSEVHY